MRGTPTGSNNMDGNVPRAEGNIPSYAVIRVFNPVGVGVLCSSRTQGAPLARRPWAFMFYHFVELEWHSFKTYGSVCNDF